jgi:hypothetical protein
MGMLVPHAPGSELQAPFRQAPHERIAYQRRIPVVEGALIQGYLLEKMPPAVQSVIIHREAGIRNGSGSACQPQYPGKLSRGVSLPTG